MKSKINYERLWQLCIKTAIIAIFCQTFSLPGADPSQAVPDSSHSSNRLRSAGLFASAITKIVTPDHEDPDYTDVCYEITREMCDFCCLVDFEFCSRDIGICDPVTDRHLIIIVHCVFVLGLVLCGFPLVVAFVKCFILFRFLEGFYPDTAGVSCYELIMRSACILCCVKFSQTYKVEEEAEEDEDSIKNKGPIFKLFYYLCCCFICPGLVLKKGSAPAEGEDGEEGEGMELAEGEGEEEEAGGEEAGGGDGGGGDGGGAEEAPAEAAAE